jgi:hypothetical protein
MRWIVVLALVISACTADPARSMGQATQPYSRTYSERSQYQPQSQQAGPFDVASDQQQRQSDQKQQQRESESNPQPGQPQPQSPRQEPPTRN